MKPQKLIDKAVFWEALINASIITFVVFTLLASFFKFIFKWD